MSRTKTHHRFSFSLSFLALLLGAAALSAGCSDEKCESGGKSYSAGETWDCECGACICEEDGTISRTDIGCIAGATGK